MFSDKASPPDPLSEIGEGELPKRVPRYIPALSPLSDCGEGQRASARGVRFCRGQQNQSHSFIFLQELQSQDAKIYIASRQRKASLSRNIGKASGNAPWLGAGRYRFGPIVRAVAAMRYQPPLGMPRRT